MPIEWETHRQRRADGSLQLVVVAAAARHRSRAEASAATCGKRKCHASDCDEPPQPPPATSMDPSAVPRPLMDLFPLPRRYGGPREPPSRAVSCSSARPALEPPVFQRHCGAPTLRAPDSEARASSHLPGAPCAAAAHGPQAPGPWTPPSPAPRSDPPPPRRRRLALSAARARPRPPQPAPLRSFPAPLWALHPPPAVPPCARGSRHPQPSSPIHPRRSQTLRSAREHAQPARTSSATVLTHVW